MNEYTANLGFQLCFLTLEALLLDVLVRRLGYLTFAHGVAVACGGYCGLLTLNHTGDLWLGLCVVGACSGALGFGLSAIAASLSRESFMLVTLVTQIGATTVLKNLSDTTGGDLGLGLSSAALRGLAPEPHVAAWWLLTGGLLITALITAYCESSRRKLVLTAFREREKMVIDAGLSKAMLVIPLMMATTVAAAICGFARGLFEMETHPSASNLDFSLMILSVVIMGSVLPILGCLSGAATMVLVPEVLVLLGVGSVAAAKVRAILFSVIVFGYLVTRWSGSAGSVRTW